MKPIQTGIALILALCLQGCPADPQPADPPPRVAVPADDAPVDLPAAPTPPSADGPEDRSDEGLAAALEGRAPVADRTLEAWLQSFAQGGDRGYVAERRAQDELYLYATESMAVTGFCLKDAVDPHRGAKGKVRWEARAARAGAPDVLRARWEAAGFSLTLTEGVNALFVQAEPTAQPAAPLTAARLRSRIDAVVRTTSPDHRWTWDVPADADLTRGTHLFSNRGAPEHLVLMQTRDDRADVLVVEGRVIFVFYKKIAQRVGFEEADTWFRDSTRRSFTGS